MVDDGRTLSVVAFLDTNAFLHYAPISEVDWLDLLKADDAVIMISHVVIRELNKQKDLGEKKKLRKRAGSALMKIAALSRQSAPAYIRNCVELRFREHDPLIDFPAYKLNDKLSDDWLIATMLEYRQEVPGIRLVLVTNDVGLELKAIGHGLECLELPENYMLPDDPDPDQIRTQELERELLAYKKNLPDLRLAFEGGRDRIQIRLVKVPLGSEEEVCTKMAEVRATRPKVVKADRYSGADLMRGGVGPLDIDRYNKRMDEFYRAYEQYLKATGLLEDSQRRLCQLDLVLENAGSCPAKDIDVDLHLPDGLRVADDVESLLTYPSEPKAPEGPKSLLQERAEMIGSIKPVSGLDIGNIELRAIEDIGRNVSRPVIRRTDSLEIHFHVRELKHTCQADFDPLFVLFDSWATTRSFTIDYELLASNVPRLVAGQLHIIVDTAEIQKNGA